MNPTQGLTFQLCHLTHQSIHLLTKHLKRHSIALLLHVVQPHPTVTCHVTWLATSIAMDGLLPLAALLGTCAHILRRLVGFHRLLVLTLHSRLQLSCKIDIHGHWPMVVLRVELLTTTSFVLALSFTKTWHLVLAIASKIQGTISAFCNFLRLLQSGRLCQTHLQLYLGLKPLHEEINQVTFLRCIVPQVHNKTTEKSNVLLHSLCLPNSHDAMAHPIFIIYIAKGRL